MSKFQIFKAGTRTDHNGNTVTITEADVAQAAAAYDPERNQAPIVIGHPADNAPAYGWVAGLSADGGVLSADFAQVDDGLKELVRAGRYKKVSASFYPPAHPANPKPGVWYLRHLGFLGAAAPAVKGLQPINFCADTAGIVEFSEVFQPEAEAVGLLRRLLRLFGVRDFAEADETDRLPETTPPNPPQPEDKESPMTITPEQLAAEKAAREQAEAAAAQAKAELKKLQDEQEQALRDAAHEANADFAESLVQSGHLKPADKDLVVQVLDFAEYPEHTTADFGEGEAKKPLATALRDFFKAVLPQQFPGGEVAKQSGKPAGAVSFTEGMTHHQRAVALMQAEGIDYATAARRTAQA
ncbi:hypothetical protein [Neisseria shayeganii]|uniref:2-oxoacid:acceptor oxidoreductase n=1 Tax=Neisseria shayeganii 871 TaxID=1032488 RepID=G4CJG5_9NEIS|nr:hypothetical protein [Neisseria shayeganii]EGY52016.1 2-oxoacid:acceptor oxidoreductase [Neisseria shayeganii 871]